ncbi:DUF4245 domain-containing protein [Streptomyces sp. NPDC058045]|uniref:DUF4245 domain-containing protein n=1 Tax=Streptomyces sp. NPDC058045 TaxID=3346311 RepID=UPI0036EC2A3B
MAGTKGSQSVRNMVWSLGVVVLVAAFAYIFIPHDDTETPIKRVDYRIELATARRAAPYPVVAPEGLGTSWKATSVRYRGDDFATWHLGFRTPDGQYAAVEQSTEKPSAFIARSTQDAEKTARTEHIGDRTWQRYEGGHYDALVLREGKATTVVTGTADFKRLAHLAAALKSAEPSEPSAPSAPSESSKPS